MDNQIQALCNMTILLYHVAEMEKKGVIKSEHAKKLNDMIRQKCQG